MEFNKAKFIKAFDASLAKLADSEKVTKAELMSLSRSVLEAHHVTQDVGFINRLIGVLTPVNRKVAILYFQEFSGFKWNADSQAFTGKDKKKYDEQHKKALDFLADPLNNIWSWAAREVEVEKKDFDLDRLKKQLESTLKKAADAQFSQLQVLETMMEAGLKLDTVLALMDKVQGKAEA